LPLQRSKHIFRHREQRLLGEKVELYGGKEFSQTYGALLQLATLESQRNNEVRYLILQPWMRDCSKLK
jgi:hypothetical protein